MSDNGISRQIKTVGELEAYIAELKKDGHVTSDSPLAGIDVDGGSSGAKAGCTAHVFNPNANGHGEHMFAVWGNYKD